MNAGIKTSSPGFSLIEVMVATAVFSLGLGGLSALLLTAAGGTIEARNQSMAAFHAESLAEMIAMTPGELDHYVDPDSGSLHLRRWHTQLSEDLPRADGLVCRDGTPEDGHAAEPACDGGDALVVKVFWLEARHLDDEDGGLRRYTRQVSTP